LITIAVTKGRSVKKDLKIGICGEHGGDPASIDFCHKVGMNYVSCSPYRVPIARLAAAQAALRRHLTFFNTHPYVAAAIVGDSTGYAIGTRLGPLTRDRPKSLVDVQGRPFLAWQLDLLRRHGVTDVVLCVGHLAEAIERHFGDGSAFGVRLRYSDEGDRRLGTAGALKWAEGLLGEAFFVMFGDSYLLFDFRAIMEHFLARACRDYGLPGKTLGADARAALAARKPAAENTSPVKTGEAEATTEEKANA